MLILLLEVLERAVCCLGSHVRMTALLKVGS